MNNLQNDLQELMSKNSCSIFDLAYSVDFDMDDYEEYLLEKMKGRAEVLFSKVKEHISRLSHFSSSVKLVRVSDINGDENGSGMNVVFSLKGKDYILIYNLWDMANYPKDHIDSVTLMTDIHEPSKDIDDIVTEAVAPYLNVTTTDVDTKIAISDIATDESLLVVKSVLNNIDNILG